MNVILKGGKSLIKTLIGVKISKVSRLFIVNTSYITFQKLSMNTINKLSLSTTRYLKWHSTSRLLESQTRGHVRSSLQTSLLLKGRLTFRLEGRNGANLRSSGRGIIKRNAGMVRKGLNRKREAFT